jgi:UDP-N-acetylmuramate dehydrogenase
MRANPFSGFSKILKTGEPMAKHTTFRVGGPARFFLSPTCVDELCGVLNICRAEGLDPLFLGGGSNLLVSDEGVSAPVVHFGKLKGVEFAGGVVRAGAGVPTAKLVALCVAHGLSGIEALAGIPGTVGGAVVMNAGGKYGNIGDFVRSVTVVHGSGTKILTGSQLKFEYRHTNLRSKAVVGIELGLEKAMPAAIRERLRKILAEKRQTQPLSAWSAGCVFKNPPKDSAGRLIDGCGLKGRRVGGAVVSMLHANFILNEGAASASDILALIEIVRNEVKTRFRVRLEPEIEIWD